LELVPSLQVTMAAVAVLAGAAAAGAAAAGAAGAAAGLVALVGEADLLMPPCPLQAPRPPCGDVVPSIQVTGALEVSCAQLITGAASSAAVSIAPQTRPLEFVTFICSAPRE
jgi:hypothetical protein